VVCRQVKSQLGLYLESEVLGDERMNLLCYANVIRFVVLAGKITIGFTIIWKQTLE
jgi:hypothetical protein